MAKDKDASKDAAKAAKKAAKKAMDERENERRTRVKAALFLDGGAPRNALEGLAAFTKFERNGIEADIFQTSVEEPSWTPELETFIFDLTKQNMEELYKASPDWGWSDKKKKAELFVPEMRFLIARARSDATLLGFVAFTCLLEGEYDVSYVWELQMTPAMQRKGLGKHMMQTLELATRKLAMHWVFLTVQKANTSAFSFYMSKMKYDLAEESPSKHGIEAGHEILSKCVDPKGWQAALDKREAIFSAAGAKA